LRLKSAAHLFGTVAAVALLSACASKPRITSQQESSRYLSRAGGNYTPPGSSSDPWGPYVREASNKYDVPERWIREVMRQESGGKLYGRGGELITSGAGAMGLMQVMPATYDDLRSRYRELGDDPYDPHNNILAGTAYLREMYDIYGAPGFLAAYNAGPGRLDDYLTRNRTLPEETRRYVAAIGPRISGHEPRSPSPGAMYAMNAVPLDIPSGPRYPSLSTQFAANTTPSAPIVLNATRLNAPIQVAEAPRPVIKLNPPEPVLAPQPVLLEPIQVAQAEERPNGFIRLSEPAHSLLGAAASRPVQAARAPEEPIPEPPLPVPAPRSRYAQRSTGHGPIEVAEFQPPRIRAQRVAAAAELVPVGPHGRVFGLIPSANAAPIRHVAPPAGAAGGAWAVQVGAFANQNLANAATAAARDHAREVLGGARTSVAGVRQTGGTLYRARLTGLSRDAAAHACERLSRARTSCMVVSPEAQ